MERDEDNLLDYLPDMKDCGQEENLGQSSFWVLGSYGKMQLLGCGVFNSAITFSKMTLFGLGWGTNPGIRF
jgi:hypothetical protein